MRNSRGGWGCASKAAWRRALSIGNVGRLDDPMRPAISPFVESVLGREALHIGDGEGEIETLAWCTGAAQGFIEQAQALGGRLFKR